MTAEIGNKGDKRIAGNTFKSVYMNNAEKAKVALDTVSPSFCLAKWNQVSLHLTTGHTNSCYHPPLHKIPTDTLESDPSTLHNTPHKKEQRKLMLDGKRPAECSYCWTMEDLGKLSDRHYRSGEPWAMKDFNKIKTMPWDANVIPTYVEVNFSNVCNLKCSYCSPQFSSTWMAEAKEHGAFPTIESHNDPAYFTGDKCPIPNKDANPYVDAFWKWWPTLYPKLEHFRMTGGEPLMDPNTYKVFNHILGYPNVNLHLSVTSNFTVEDKIFNRYINCVQNICYDEKIEHFMQYVSCDTVGKQAEYIRHGLDYNKLTKNVNTFLEEVPFRSSLTFIITMSNLSIFGLKDMLQNILELRKTYSNTYQRVWFDTPVLRSPNWQSLQTLPIEYSSILEDSIKYMKDHSEVESDLYHGFKDYEIQKMERDLEWMRSPIDENDKIKAMKNFYKFFNEHDRRRNTNFRETFPELTTWYDSCANLANGG